MQTSEMRFDNDGHQLVGTLVSPTLDGGPVALLVSGSGPIDRESNAKRLSISVMRDVAERLALRGVGSFRYDKRGVGESGGDYRSAGLYDNVADARAAVAALRARSDVGPIVIVGHSEGALIGAEVAANDPDLAGIVVLSGAAVDGKAVLRRQGELVAATLPRPVKWLMRMLRQDLVRTQSKRLVQLEKSTRDVERIQLVRVNAKWFREFLAHDPSASLARIEVPVLALTGSKDIQVDPSDIETMRSLVRAEFEGAIVPDLSHLLRVEEGEPSVRTYKKQVRHPVDAGLLDRVADWVSERASERNGSTPETV